MSHIFDEFVHISSSEGTASNPPQPDDGVSNDFLENAKGTRWFTEGVVVSAIRRQHPTYHLTITPTYKCDLLSFANAHDNITYLPHGDPNDSLLEKQFIPPVRRYNDETGGAFGTEVVFGCYDYFFNDNNFLVYIVEGSDGFGKTKFNYILVDGATSKLGQQAAEKQSDELIAAATVWGLELHDEVLVFDGGMWQKSAELWDNIQKSDWEDVILEDSKKEAIINDVTSFFGGEARYEEFGVPWKV